MTSHDMPRSRIWSRQLTSLCLVGLILLCTGWELQWAPVRPGGSWLVLKVLPLLALLPGVLKGRVYAYQWGSMMILLYLAEGLVRATSDRDPTSIQLAWGETVLSTAVFVGTLMYARTFKKTKTPIETSPKA